MRFNFISIHNFPIQSGVSFTPTEIDPQTLHGYLTNEENQIFFLTPNQGTETEILKSDLISLGFDKPFDFLVLEQDSNYTDNSFYNGELILVKFYWDQTSETLKTKYFELEITIN